MLIQFLQNNRWFRKIIYRVGKARAKDMIDHIQPFLDKKDTIIDIGAGSCNVCEILSKKNYKIRPIDVKNLSFIDDIQPLIFDGTTIPFDDNTFDTSLILTVLHHTPEPEKIVQEAKRVSKKIIIMEDVYSNWFRKYITYFFDSLLNWEFIGHPHTNKSDAEWKKTFDSLGLKLLEARYDYSLIVFKHAVYYLKK